MPLSLICASHTPLLHRVSIDDATAETVKAGFARLAGHVRAFDPEIVIQFAPDHFQGFFHRLMPSFCVGLAARSAEDWDIAPGSLDVPEATARLLVDRLLDDGFDIAVSRDMVVDHGFLQMWQEMFGRFDNIPLIPIFINCAAPPLPRYRRVRQLGEAVGRFARDTGKRVLLVASGGLSHDPPIPDVDKAPPEVRARLVNGTPRTSEEKAAHEAHLAGFGRLAEQGEGPCGPLNPEWDTAFLDILSSGELVRLDDFRSQDVRDAAGRAANEVLAWVAACSALSAAGTYEMTREYYHPIPAWIAGMAMVSARTKTG